MGYRKVFGVFLAAGMGLCLSASAQLEGKTLQVMLGQIVALDAYSAAAAQGYRLVENGVHTIADIRRGEWGLHQTYYGSLRTVNPAVRGMAEVSAVLRSGNTGAVGDLRLLLTDGQLSMTDGERMRRVIVLYNELRRNER